MKFIADFHIHSHYSIATSKDLTPENLEKWALLKGIQVVGTGDMIHPGWYKELEEKLIPSDDGLFLLNHDYRLDDVKALYADKEPVRFMLTAEISSIYKKNGKTRKVHNLIMTSSFDTLKNIQTRLDALGNIRSDGRPILGLPSKDLLEIVLESGDDAVLIPAHIWTPWFSVLGSKSGYDTIEECFEDLTKYIFAVETGLSSDPPMNRVCSFLDKFTLISNSDAHSPEKLGREANIFDTEITYESIIAALNSRHKHKDKFLGTIEFFPEEGKYHLDGHRKCGISWTPRETAKHKGICPVCGKKVTIGVLNRVIELADRTSQDLRTDGNQFFSLTPLKSLISEIVGIGPNSKKVNNYYESLVKRGGSEFSLLLDLPLDRIKEVGDEILSEGIRRLRNREVYIKGGFDGEFGKVTVFQPGEVHSLSPQMSLFGSKPKRPSLGQARPRLPSHLKKVHRRKDDVVPTRENAGRDMSVPEKRMNEEQADAVNHYLGPSLILAGPGTGKTFTLTTRIVHLIKDKGVEPSEILAVTFTNKAAQEMKSRISLALPHGSTGQSVTVSTFHSLGLEILRKHAPLLLRSAGFAILDEDDQNYVLKIYLDIDKKETKQTLSDIKDLKNRGLSPEEIKDRTFSQIYREYQMILEKEDAFDIDDLIVAPVQLLSLHPDVARSYRDKYRFICVDEYQDINLAQYRLIRLLAPDKAANICVIGDPNQAIYAFRGADVKFIRNFQDDYPSARTYRLKTSYRCSNTILQASTQVIGDRVGKSMIEGLNKGVSIKVREFPTAKSEAEFVARTIEKMMGGVRFFSLDSEIADGDAQTEITSFSDFAVLFRVAKMASDLEKAMNDHGIPYQLVGEEPFFRQEPIVSIIDVLRLTTVPDNEVLFRKLQDKQIKNITASWRSTLERKTSQGKIRDRIKEIITTHFPGIKGSEIRRVDQLLSLADAYDGNFPGFLSFIQLGGAADTYNPKNEQVALMSLHAAKGLEFTSVFIVGCEDGIIPYSLFHEYRANLEEERRLFYVGMTRAQQFLYLTHANRRSLYGRSLRLPLCPFVSSITAELLLREKGQHKPGDKETGGEQLSFF